MASKSKRRGRGEGSITQREDGTWMGQVSLGTGKEGKRRRKTVYGATKTEVMEKLRRVQADYGMSGFADPEGMTVEQFLLFWVDGTAKVKVAHSTYTRYRQVVDYHLIPYIGKLKLEKLETFHVAALFIDLNRDGISLRGQQLAGVVLGIAMRSAVRLKLRSTNPCTEAVKPRPEHKDMVTWNQEQARAFLKAAEGERLYPLFVVALDTGARLGELLGLQWPDIDFQAGTVSIQRSLEEVHGAFRLKAPKTKKGKRMVSLSRFALDALHEHRKAMLAEGNASGQVFWSETGTYLRQSNLSRRVFRSAMQRAGVPKIRFHDLRHTNASLLLQAGVNIKVVSERLGHESIEITLDHYAHLMPGMQEGAASVLGSLWSGQAPKEQRAAENGSK